MKWFGIIILNCPGIVSVDMLKIILYVWCTKMQDLEKGHPLSVKWVCQGPVVQSSIDRVVNIQYGIYGWKDTGVYHSSVPERANQLCHIKCNGECHWDLL